MWYKCGLVEINCHQLREKCPYSQFFWSVFFRIRTEYEEIQSISPYSIEIRENRNQKNSEYEHFSHSYHLWATVVKLIRTRHYQSKKKSPQIMPPVAKNKMVDSNTGIENTSDDFNPLNYPKKYQYMVKIRTRKWFFYRY